MAQKENQRIALTKKLLQEGLLRLLETKSLDKISVTELCRESGINRATFYNHYNSPLELLTDIENRITLELKSIIGTPKTPEEVIGQVEAVCEHFHKNARTIMILHKCHSDEEITAALYDLNKNFQYYRMSEKYTQTLDSDSLKLVSIFFYTGCYSILLNWIKEDLQKTPKEIADLMIRLATENFIQ